MKDNYNSYNSIEIDIYELDENMNQYIFQGEYYTTYWEFSLQLPITYFDN